MDTIIKRIYFNTDCKIYFVGDYFESRDFKGCKLDCFESDLHIEENKLKQYNYNKCTMIEYYLKTNNLKIKEVKQ